MPTILTHAVAGAGVAVLVSPIPSPAFLVLSAALGALPDLDVVGFYLGVPYHSFLGHRGFSHSLCCSAVVSVLVALATTAWLGGVWWLLWLAFFLAITSHALLDGCTNGGLGVAFFSPFDTSRYFLPWRPIQVSTIGLRFGWPRMLRVFSSEFCWVWLPLAVALAVRLLAHRFGES
jgi:inner membrane protein